MSTQFTDIFDEFLNTEINSLDISKYSPPQLSKYLSILLRRSREEVYNLIYTNASNAINKMDDVIEFYSQEYSFEYTGTVFLQILNPLPIENSSLYITINDIPTMNYVYDKSTGNITITDMPNQLNTIDVIAYKNGQFNQTLNLIEQGILLDWMAVTFQKDKIKEQRLYNISIYGKDYGEKSQANHIKALSEVYEMDRKNVTTKTLEYTYRNNPNGFKGFGGRGGV